MVVVATWAMMNSLVCKYDVIDLEMMTVSWSELWYGIELNWIEL